MNRKLEIKCRKSKSENRNSKVEMRKLKFGNRNLNVNSESQKRNDVSHYFPLILPKKLVEKANTWSADGGGKGGGEVC